LTTMFSVEEVSALLSITPRTLHYYEEIGLIPPIPRTEGGHRYYNQEAVDRLEHILRIKNLLGSSLQEISEILRAEENLNELKLLYRNQDSDEEKMKILYQAAGHLEVLVETIDDKMDKLQNLRGSFQERLENINRLKKKDREM
jgi:DNA-binding transcriptional MerR regulator